MAGQQLTLDLAGVTVDELAMNPFQEFLHLLSDPNISFILFTIGFYGLLFELQNPNFVTGILGALAIVLAFIGFGSLPLNVGGLLLVLLAMVLFGLELTVTSHGLLGVGGLICFALGASALFTQPGDPFEPLASVAPSVIATTTVTAGVFLLLIVCGRREEPGHGRARRDGRQLEGAARRASPASSGGPSNRSARSTSAARSGRPASVDGAAARARNAGPGRRTPRG